MPSHTRGREPLSAEHALFQQVQLSPTIHLALEQFQAIDRSAPLLDHCSTVAAPPLLRPADRAACLWRNWFPTDIAIGKNGDVYVTDTNNLSIRRIDPLGNVTTVLPRSAGITPCGIAIDARNNIYFTDSIKHLIYKLEMR